MFSILSPQHAPSVYSILAASTSDVLFPLSICFYKIPLVLALLLHPHSLKPDTELQDPDGIVELGSSV